MRPSTSLPSFAVLSLLAACTPSTPTPPGGDGGTSGARPDFDAMVAGGDCPSAQGAGVEHSSDITADETWRASDGPHRIVRNIRITATLTLEACTTVVLGDRVTVQVGTSAAAGKIVALGEMTGSSLRPVRFVAEDPSTPWGSLTVDSTGSLDLSYTALVGGANPATAQNGGGALLVYGITPKNTEDPVVTASVKTNWLLVEDPSGFGVNFVRTAGFAPGAHGLAVRGAKDTPIAMDFQAAETLPREIVLSGNVRDEIDLNPVGASLPSTTIKDVGWPYRVLRAVYVGSVVDGTTSTLTIEPGVTLRFSQQTNASGIYVGTSSKRLGVIVARGTAEKPIVFTSAKAAPAPGDWMGLYFRYYPTSGNAIEHAVIQYAGAPSGAQGYGCGPAENDASVLLLGDRPDDAFITSTTFENGGGDTGIVLGWKSDASGPDFKTPNTFVNMPACAVSRWRNGNGSCPSAQPECL
jgi:hypothetical protein